MEVVKISVLAFTLLLSGVASATAMIKVEGKVTQIKNGRVEIASKKGVSRLELKRLTPQIRKSLTDAVGKKRNVTVYVAPSAMKKPKK